MQVDGRTLSHEISETIRRMAVERVREGERPSAVIKSYGLCRTTIYKWLRAVRRSGPEALKAREHPGRKPALSPRQKLQVRKWINGKDPRQYGFDFGLWTRQIVAELIAQKCGVKLGVTAIVQSGGGDGRIGKDDIRILSRSNFERRIEELKEDSEGAEQNILIRGIYVLRQFCIEQ